MRRLLVASTLALGLALSGSQRAAGQTTDVVVGVPIENGQAGRPQPGVLIHPNETPKHQEPVPVPVIVNDGGTTHVQKNFGGGYTVDGPGKKKTTVRPKFGGGYTVQQNGKTTTEVTPTFGGGYEVKSKPGAPPTVIVPEH